VCTGRKRGSGGEKRDKEGSNRSIGSTLVKNSQFRRETAMLLAIRPGKKMEGKVREMREGGTGNGREID